MKENQTPDDGCAPSACGSCSEFSCPSAQAAAPEQSAASPKQAEAPKESTMPKHAAPQQNDEKLKARLGGIKRTIIVMSGKGGVGKSTVAVNLAMSAMLAGQRVGLLDVDLHGPSVPTMLGLEGRRLVGDEEGMIPMQVGGLSVISVAFLLENADSPVVWRGPLKMGVIRQFIEEVNWGDLDLLVVDVPPGTGDEPLSICQLIPELFGAVIVTTPQKVASVDVRKSISFCKELGVRVLGVVENMSGFACPGCGEVTPIMGSGGGRVMAEDMHVPFLGTIPIDPMIVQSGDEGQVFIALQEASPAAQAFRDIVQAVITQ